METEHTYPPQLTLALKVFVGIIGIIIISTLSIFIWIKMHQEIPAEAPQEISYRDDSNMAPKYLYIEPQPFVYILVPSAPTAITLPPPVDSDTELAEYDAALATLTPEEKIAVDSDTVYGLTFDTITYDEFSESLPDQDRYLLYQIHDELRQLTLQFNTEYNRAPLFDRHAEVTQLATLQPAVYGEEIPSVYPSIRAVEGFLVAEVYSRINPAKAAEYNKIAKDFAQRGIAYGLYSQSDVDAAQALVSQYFGYLEATPNYLSVLTRLQVPN